MAYHRLYATVQHRTVACSATRVAVADATQPETIQRQFMQRATLYCGEPYNPRNEILTGRPECKPRRCFLCPAKDTRGP